MYHQTDADFSVFRTESTEQDNVVLLQLMFTGTSELKMEHLLLWALLWNWIVREVIWFPIYEYTNNSCPAVFCKTNHRRQCTVFKWGKKKNPRMVPSLRQPKCAVRGNQVWVHTKYNISGHKKQSLLCKISQCAELWIWDWTTEEAAGRSQAADKAL